RYGTSCSQELTHAAADFLRDLGYSVSINKPYAGGFITEHYGRPENQLHAIQIEINRAIYMDEVHFKHSSNFVNLQSDLATFTSRLVSIPEYIFNDGSSLAAE
ncbi:MAG: N-formylglutamate amidohydrolase, partial [Rhizobiales bacterium]|nr:N-formylglutamate amidohydrolase [Hyphomicrobiales bacterium]